MVKKPSDSGPATWWPVLIVLSGLLVIWVVPALLDLRATRFLPTHRTARVVMIVSVAIASVAWITTGVRIYQKGLHAQKDSLRKTLGFFLYGFLPITTLALLFGFLLHSALLCFVSLAGTGEATLQTTVTESGSNVAYRSSRVRTLRFMAAGDTPGELVIEDSIWNGHGTRLQVNGVCTISSLPKGLPITLKGRRSSFGFLVDSITSPEDCQRKER